MSLITSPQNPLIKQLRRLSQRKHRRREGLFVVEGIRPVLAALENGWSVQQLIVCPERLNSPVALDAVAAAAERGLPVAEIGAALLDKVAGWEHGTGLLALVASALPALSSWQVPEQALLLAVEAPGDPGNLGTIMRTLDAVAGYGLILVGGGTDPFHPGAVRASMGALFTVPVAAVASLAELYAWAGAQQLPVWATSARATDDCWSAEWPARLMLLMGSEQTGLSAEALAAAANQIRIPMWGDASSLNLAIASSLLLYEYRRRFPA
ncbi:MAG: RNA methyltransferase [Anaerolineales bacterium]|nr:RNA methyltransferase [Anaerolineales bacterium]